MPVPASVQELIERFDRNRAAYHSGQYNEAQVRQEFINPFWAALGWDVYNAQGYSERYKEVIHEDALKVQGKNKAPDYAFRLGGQRLFFVEAKKPAVRIKDEPSPAYQLRRYAWSAKLPLSVLTDFEEFAVYDCRARPQQADQASTARVIYATYDEYPARWDEIAGLFAPDAIRKGALERYVESARAQRGTAEVDAAFLQEIEQWREMLARNLALRNPGLGVRALNHAVQMTIDRLIFLRICEDRGIEPYHRLGDAVAGGKGIYPQLGYLFRQADDRYNSGLFHFHPETGREGEHDDWTLGLQIDDRVLKEMVGGLYYPECPYEFSVLPADLLGQVYEQFLGRVIRLTPGGRAKVEEKPEVKKAGGVYYTPTYIVDYIVKQTVGALLEGKTPRQVRGSPRYPPLRVLDPACGSGTFLLQAYQCLLDWYLEGYLADDPELHARQGRLAPAASSEWRLTGEERKRILLAHIYGVDIDPQAVEVTKLSLLLKVLEEGEGPQQISFVQERALPDLGQNVQCGNSLIGPDYYEGRQLALFDEDEMYRVNAFDWKARFPKAWAAGGFDAVIGNPPYIRIQAMKQWAPQEVEFYKERYVSASKGNYDIYVVFVEKGLSLLRREGWLGYILPHKFFNAQYGEPLRGLIAEGSHLSHVVHFGAEQVFSGATTYTCLLFLDKAGNDKFAMAKVDDLLAWRVHGVATQGIVQSHKVSSDAWNFIVGPGGELFDKLSDNFSRLGDVADIYVGLQTSADKVFIMDLVDETEQTLRLQSRALGTEWVFEKGLLFPIISGTDVNRYRSLPKRQYVLFPYKVEGSSVELLDMKQITQAYPQTAAYLLENKRLLEDRERGRLKGGNWHGYIYLKNMTRQAIQKICVPRLVDRLYAAYDREGGHFLDNVDVGGIVLKPAGEDQGLLYLLGLLNSKLLRWYFPFVSAPFRGGWLSANRQFLSRVPIRVIDFGDSSDKAHHARMISLVERMLDLQERLSEAKTPQAKRLLQQQIEITDQEIDRLVYALYGLTEDEIAVVEGAGE